jgi:hypothetical protein
MKRTLLPSIRFRLRTLFVVVTVICVWFAYNSFLIHREVTAIAAIQAVNGEVRYGKPWNPQYHYAYSTPSPQRSRLARIILGSGTNDHVCIVRLHAHIGTDEEFNDDDLNRLITQLAGLGGVRELDLDGRTKITNRGIHRLSQIESLEILYLCNVSIDDSAVPQLISLRRLRFLDIYRTNISLTGAMQVQDALPNCNIRGPKKSIGYFSDAD